MAKCKRLLPAAERGFCGGVRSALSTLDEVLKRHPGEPVYVLHELVHNRHVTDGLRLRGVRFVSEVEQVPEGALLMLGAHGVSPELEAAARRRTDRVTDACCPLVKARQREAAGLCSADTLILLGYPGHPEVIGILGWSQAGKNIVISGAAEAEELPEPEHPVLLTQTTFDAGELERCRNILKRRFHALNFRGGLCRASLERQRSVADVARRVELVVVAGSAHSSNARRLCEAAEREGARSVLVESAVDIPPEVFSLSRVGLTAGASTPDQDIEAMEAAFVDAGFEICMPNMAKSEK